MNPTHNINNESGHDTQTSVENVFEMFINDGFRLTDAQFNIGRLQASHQASYDIIHPQTLDRWLLTERTPHEPEVAILKALGQHAIFDRDFHTDNYAVYKLPIGTRPLIKTLRNHPYASPYMRQLAQRSAVLLKQLQTLDEPGFGVDIDSIAITHNGDDAANDNAFLTVVPPLRLLSPDLLDRQPRLGSAKLSPQILNQIQEELGDQRLTRSSVFITRYFDLLQGQFKDITEAQ